MLTANSLQKVLYLPRSPKSLPRFAIRGALIRALRALSKDGADAEEPPPKKQNKKRNPAVMVFPHSDTRTYNET